MPPQLENRDLMAMAETGSGKTAAFVLPVLQALIANPVNLNPREAATLILAPTRELAVQIEAEVASLSRNMSIRRAVVLGGVGKGPQIAALRRGVHVLVATPGRLLDLVNERHADLRSVRTFILDEADRMFDMGFIRDIRKIASMISHRRRTAMFSATMPDEIRKLANELLKDPVRVDLSPKQLVVGRINQKVMIVPAKEKQSRLHTILSDTACSRVIVFTRTKRGADRVTERLDAARISAVAIHGNKAQNARQRALADFSTGKVRVLVATDIAARGIDVSDVSHVINFDMPMEPETYVHRIGRTARKGTSGIAISLCDPSERTDVKAIERLMKQTIPIIDDVGGEHIALPERRPHHKHDAPRREGDHRSGPRTANANQAPRNRGNAGGRQQASHDRQRRTDSAVRGDVAPVSQHPSQARNSHGDAQATRAADRSGHRGGRDKRVPDAAGHKGAWRGQEPPKFLKGQNDNRGRQGGNRLPAR